MSIFDKYKDENGMVDLCKLSEEELDLYAKEQNMKDGFYRFIVVSEPYLKYVNLAFSSLFAVFSAALGTMAFKLISISTSATYVTLFYMGVCITLTAIFKKKSGY